MKQTFKVKLNDEHSADETQISNGYLGDNKSGYIYQYERRDAKKKAMMFGGKVEEIKPTFLVADLKIGQIDENNLLDGVVKLLKNMESFVDVQKGIGDKLYPADVFEKILNIFVCSDKTLAQLQELVMYFIDYDYIMVINCHKDNRSQLGLDR